MRKRPPRPRPKEAELTIESVGARGDGVATFNGKPVFLPFTLAGDRVKARLLGERGEVLEFLHEAPRQAPPCPHFGACGGCALQHMPEDQYNDWKRGRVIEALSKKGLGDAWVAKTFASPLASRRRLTLAFQARSGKARLGFHERRSHAIVDVATCPIAHPDIEALFDPLRSLLAGLSFASGKLTLTVSETGLDVLITTATLPTLADREALADFALARDLARLSLSEEGEDGSDPPEILSQQRLPLTRMVGTQVPLAPGGFLQATQDGESALQAAVLDWVDGRRVADLFAGCGTFSLPLLGHHRLTAVENDAQLMASLTSAAGGRIRTEVRDLFLSPLMAEELNDFDTVIMDPPRAGAFAQTRELAKSTVPTVIAISCNPATFARDARLLVDGGYCLKQVRPVDQFLWSPHVELAALFTR